MAKERKTHSIVSAITAVTTALRLESIPNPTANEKHKIHQAKIQAANVIDDSNFITVAENIDDDIEEQHQREEEAAEAEIAEQQLNRNE